MKKARSSRRINKIGTTTDTITGRGGLALFSRYLEMIGIFDIISSKFGFMRKRAPRLDFVQADFLLLFGWNISPFDVL